MLVRDRSMAEQDTSDAGEFPWRSDASTNVWQIADALIGCAEGQARFLRDDESKDRQMNEITWIRVGRAMAASTLLLLTHCSGTTTESSNPDAGSAGASGSGGAGAADAADDGDATEEVSYGPYTPTPNGVAMSEMEACTVLLGAVAENVDRLGCTYAAPDCPEYLRNSGAPICSQYDEGTVQGCADFYAVFTSCAEFQSRPCHIQNIENSAPNGCDADAG